MSVSQCFRREILGGSIDVVVKQNRKMIMMLSFTRIQVECTKMLKHRMNFPFRLFIDITKYRLELKSKKINTIMDVTSKDSNCMYTY